jgi:hypothetical protein
MQRFRTASLRYWMRQRLRARGASFAVFVGAAVLTSNAEASQLVDRNVRQVTFAVNTTGEALVTYRAGGRLKHVLAWGAENAIAPTRSRPQVAFKLDYAGGWVKYHSDYWKTFNNGCSVYDGPRLAFEVAACRAPDGSYWALQAWQRMLPNYGVRPTPAQAVWDCASRTGRVRCRR